MQDDEMEIAEIPEAGKEPGHEIVDEIIEQEILEGMSTEGELSESQLEEQLADEIVEQTVISEMDDKAPSKLPKVCDMCAGELSFIDEYDAWYCYDCEKYEGE